MVAALAGDRVAPVRNGVALVPIICKLDQTCTGILRLQDARPKGAVVAAPPATYGSAPFQIAAGSRAPVKIRLSAAARKLLAKYRSRAVYANATLSLGATPVLVSMRITLRGAHG